jgi:hypothetical protein
MDGSAQCHADAATRTSKRRPPSSCSSNAESPGPGVAEDGEPLASERGHARAGLDGGHRVPGMDVASGPEVPIDGAGECPGTGGRICPA